MFLSNFILNKIIPIVNHLSLDYLYFYYKIHCTMKHHPGIALQELQLATQDRGVNPPIADSSTFRFRNPQEMFETFEGKTEGLFLYSRHSNPTLSYLEQALARMEGTEDALVTASGMGAITAVLLQLCQQGDEVVSSRTVYGGTYAFMKNFMPGLGIKTRFVDITNLQEVEASITPQTKVLYAETLSNPLLEVAHIDALNVIAKKYSLKLVIDNTFSPLSFCPAQMGADVVIHSLTKYINDSSDTLGGVICAKQEFILSLRDVNEGAAMLLGATLDSLRAASILKNLRTLPVRIQQHSKNALFLAKKFESLGLKTVYPGLASHKSHAYFKAKHYSDFGFGGMLTVDVGSFEKANVFLEMMQAYNLGDLAVSLGFYRTLFSAPGKSTSSEIPEEEQTAMGLSNGLIRFSIGLDHSIAQSWDGIKKCLEASGIVASDLLNAN